MATTLGICRNAKCPNGAGRVTVELYPGPGEFCPECGERLEAAAANPPATLTALEALERCALDGPPPRLRRRAKRPLILSAVTACAAIAALAALHPSAVGHPGIGDPVRVCRTSITERLSEGLVHAYATASGMRESKIAFAPPGACDVQFATASNANAADVIGHDAIVAIVNPANPLTHLDQDTLRRIFDGEITDWAALGAKPGPIVALAPENGTDEATDVQATLLHGAGFAAGVQRLPSSRDVTAAVVRPDNFRAIGLVAFSQSDPAKVLALGAVAPNPLSIADGRYPLALDVTVTVSPAARAGADALGRYARSEDAQTVVERSGLTTRTSP
jgi:hypothetical protein